MRLATATAAALFALPILSCGRGTETLPGERPVPVRVARVESRAYRHSVRISGAAASLDPKNLSFKVAGIVERVAAREGDFVRKGTLLGMLNQTEIRARCDQARASVEKASHDLEVARKLYPNGGVTQDQILESESAWKIATAALEIAGHNLRYSSILAPADGRILRRLGEAGEMIEAGRPLLVFSDSAADLVFRAGATDRDIVRMAPGDSAEVTFDAHPDRTVAAAVRRLPAGSNPASGLYEVELTLNPDRPSLLPGMTGEARIVTRRIERLPAIPIEAIVDASADRGYVFVMDGPTVNKRLLQLGTVIEGQVLTTGGISAGEIIVVEGAPYLRNQSPVKVIDTPDAVRDAKPSAPVQGATRK